MKMPYGTGKLPEIDQINGSRRPFIIIFFFWRHFQTL